MGNTVCYEIQDKWEETVCAICGYPLYIGDIAYCVDDGEVVCSKKCARKIGSDE